MIDGVRLRLVTNVSELDSIFLFANECMTFEDLNTVGTWLSNYIEEQNATCWGAEGICVMSDLVFTALPCCYF